MVKSLLSNEIRVKFFSFMLLALAIIPSISYSQNPAPKHNISSKEKQDTNRSKTRSISISAIANKTSSEPVPQKKEEKGDLSAIDVLNLVVASLALITSCVAIFYTHRQFERDSGIRSLEFVSEIDKMLMENPYLWQIYDENKERFPVNDPVQLLELEGKIEAFCYYCINNFELVILRNKEDGLQLYAWKSYMIHTIVHSSIFKKLVNDSCTDFFYSTDYQKVLKELVDISKLVEIYFEKYCKKEIDKYEYNELAKKTIKAELEKLEIKWWKRRKSNVFQTL